MTTFLAWGKKHRSRVVVSLMCEPAFTRFAVFHISCRAHSEQASSNMKLNISNTWIDDVACPGLVNAVRQVGGYVRIHFVAVFGGGVPGREANEYEPLCEEQPPMQARLKATV